MRCFSSHSRSYWWPRRKQQAYILGKELFYQRTLMKDGHWVRQRGDAATNLGGAEVNLQKRGYNGQASQETNNDVVSEGYINLLPGEHRSRNLQQAIHPRRHTGSTFTHNDLWITSKGSRWTSAWKTLDSQLDDSPGVHEVKNLYRSAEVADKTTSSVNSVQTEQRIDDDYDYALPFSNLSSSEIRREMGSKASHPEKSINRDSLPSEDKDTPNSLDEIVYPKAETALENTSQQPAKVPQACTSMEMPTTSPELFFQDVRDDEFLEKVQFAPIGIDTKLGLHEDTPLTSEIHILGTSPIGLHIAHSLCSSPDPPPVTLLMHRPLRMQQWLEEGAAIRIVKNGTIYSSSNIKIESAAPFGVHEDRSDRSYAGFGEYLEHTIQQPNTKITHLIVATRAQQTTAALRAIKHRLDHNSTICFVNGGMGIVEEVNELLFPHADSRPFYMQARNSHNIRQIDNLQFSVIEQETGDISLTISNRFNNSVRIAPNILKTNTGWVPSSKYIMRRFTSIPELGATGYRKVKFLEEHLQKVAANSIIGPSSVMYDCFANELLYNRLISQFATSLLEEISPVLVALPEMEDFRDRFKAFSVRRLQAIMMGECRKMGRNRTQMWHDVNHGRKTDIDYYNGYIIKRGEELGIDCTQLKLVTTMVKAKQMMKKQAMDNYIKWD